MIRIETLDHYDDICKRWAEKALYDTKKAMSEVEYEVISIPKENVKDRYRKYVELVTPIVEKVDAGLEIFKKATNHYVDLLFVKEEWELSDYVKHLKECLTKVNAALA